MHTKHQFEKLKGRNHSENLGTYWTNYMRAIFEKDHHPLQMADHFALIIIICSPTHL
jgi:hypothetical protein